MNKRLVISIILWIVLGGITLLAAQWIMSMKPKVEKKKNQERVQMVETQKVKLADHQIEIHSMGDVVPYRSIIIQSQVQGKIVSISNALGKDIERGFEVREGQELCRIEAIDYNMAIEQDKAHVAAMELAYQEERAKSKIAKDDWESLQLKGVEESDRQLALRIPHLNKAKKNLEAANAKLQLSEMNLERTIIKAPFDGVLTQWNVHLGSTVNAQTQMGELVDHRRFNVELQLKQEQLSWLPQRKHIDVHIKMADAYHPIGKLESVLPKHSPQNRLITAIASIESPLDLLPHPIFIGGFVEANIKSRPFPDSYRIERRYIVDDTWIWVYHQGTLQKKKVQFIPDGKSHVLIISGLEDGDEWIQSPLFHPVEGMKLNKKSS